jgi:quinol monooxygenase YgiN
MLALRLYMEFSPETRDEGAIVLRSLLGPVRSEPGCCATRLLIDADQDNSLIWVEEWGNASDFDRRLRAATFRRIIAVMELAAAPPRVEIDEVASRRGFDLVEEILAETEVRSTGREEALVE